MIPIEPESEPPPTTKRFTDPRIYHTDTPPAPPDRRRYRLGELTDEQLIAELAKRGRIVELVPEPASEPQP